MNLGNDSLNTVNECFYFFLTGFNVIMCMVNSQKSSMECSVPNLFQSISQDLVEGVTLEDTLLQDNSTSQIKPGCSYIYFHSSIWRK